MPEIYHKNKSFPSYACKYAVFFCNLTSISKICEKSGNKTVKNRKIRLQFFFALYVKKL